VLVKAIALMYHDVTPAGREDTSGFPGGDAARYKLTLAQFDDHLEAIRLNAGRRVDVIGHLDAGLGTAPLLLTFDDGGASAAAIADRLERAGWRGHFFVTAGYVDQPGFLAARELRDLRRRGHVVGSHSYSHPLRMARLPIGRLRDEWRRSIAVLADALGEPIDTASVPGGHNSRAVAREAADAGIRFLFTSAPVVHVRRIGDMAVIGRYVVQRSTPAAVVAAVAAGSPAPRFRQLALWEMKKVAKTIGGATYLAARDRLLGRSPKVTWGDDLPRVSKHAP
jgi:peptidoglycan/xylan/chitin deacetylase (PgdA/CDA1 family)